MTPAAVHTTSMPLGAGLPRIHTRFFGLGKTIMTNNLQEALEQAGMDWTTEQYPIETKHDIDDFGGIDAPRHRAVVRQDTKKVLGIMGNGYKPVQNIETLEMFKDIIENNEIVLQQGGIFDEGRQLWMVSKVPNDFKIGKDEIETDIVFRWSHDGSLAVTALFMPYLTKRQIALVAPIGAEAMSAYVKHTLNALQRMKQASGILANARSYFIKLIEIFMNMANKPWNEDKMDKYLNLLFPDGEAKENKDGTPRKSKNAGVRDEIMSIYGAQTDISDTMWAAFVSVADYADNFAKGRVTEGSDPRELKLESVWGGTAYNTKSKAFKLLTEGK